VGDILYALPLGSSGKVFSLTFILPSALVRFSVLSPIEPHVPPLVCPPANSLKCGAGEAHMPILASPQFTLAGVLPRRPA